MPVLQADRVTKQYRLGDVTYTVKISIEKPDLRLKWGMTGQVEIEVR